jgi:hypothetical protein
MKGKKNYKLNKKEKGKYIFYLIILLPILFPHRGWDLWNRSSDQRPLVNGRPAGKGSLWARPRDPRITTAPSGWDLISISFSVGGKDKRNGNYCTTVRETLSLLKERDLKLAEGSHTLLVPFGQERGISQPMSGY